MPDTGLHAAMVVRRQGERPRDHELDLFGLTHPGNVRKENQDHFLLCTVHQQAVVHATSLPSFESLPLRGERLATIMLVADGVGSGAGGEASRLTTETITRYISNTIKCYHTSGSAAESEFEASLKEAVFESHETVRVAAAERDKAKMATTLTLGIAVWPTMYLAQVGDSRCYYYHGGELAQVTRDQTVAQHLVDSGALPAERADASPFKHVLSSAIGGGETTPVVSRLDIRPRGCVLLFCSDGLTKHVSNEEIARELREMRSAEQACHSLLDLALAGGGTDNVTVLIGRALPAVTA